MSYAVNSPNLCETAAPALQLYTVRQELEADPRLTLARVRALGFRAVETGPLPAGRTAREMDEELREEGLRVVAVHCDLPVGEQIGHAITQALTLRSTTLIWHGWPRSPAYDSVQGVKSLAASCNRVREVALANGLRFGLHTHWWEFEHLDGKPIYQHLVQALHPEIFFEIDVYWAKVAGTNPARLIAELGARIAFLHLKDGPAVHGVPMTALGEGVVDIPRILGALRTPTQLVIEMDELAGDKFQAIERSYWYLQRMLSENQLFEQGGTEPK